MAGVSALGGGSSPLSRGIPAGRVDGAVVVGIIPALAGNTQEELWIFGESGDHPRSRGEYSATQPRLPPRRGSSPLSRGIHAIAALQPTYVGIIPALAGNTVPRRPNSSATGDHPRSRGEYPGSVWRAISRPGSSPLSRGILLHKVGSNRKYRIIPALAGNTASCFATPDATSDHPRSRGEYGSAAEEVVVLGGSSPLSRGIPHLLGPGSGFRRIIPALAGNTRFEDWWDNG